MAKVRSGIRGRTPTGRDVNDWMGRPPRASGTGPKNLAKTSQDAVSQVRPARPSASRAASPRVSPGRASAGYTPPGGGGGGSPKATTPMARAPRPTNKAKSSPPRRSSRLGKPRADFPSKI